MKRCPQCEFIYEDDQSLCDMDGVLLVLDSRALPNLHALTTVPPKTQRRSRAVPAFATLILALVLGMVYYVSTQRNTYTPSTATSTANPAPAAEAVPQDQPSDSNENPAAALESRPGEPAEEEAKPAATKSPTAAPVKKATTKTATSSQTKTGTADKKDDSKVGSIIKKTGRILKKPFKF